MAESKPTEVDISEFEIPDSGFNPEFDGTPAAEVAPKAAAQETEEKTISPYLIQIAKSAGIDESDFPATEGELQRLIAIANRIKSQQSPAAPAKPAEEEDDDDLLKDVNLDDWDEPIQKLFKSAAESRKEVKTLKKELEGSKKEQAAKEQSRLIAKADKAFSKREDVYGKGTITDLKPNSPEILKRQQIVNMACEMSKREPEADIEDLIDRAGEIMFGKVADAPKGGASLYTAAQYRNGGTMLKPSHRGEAKQPKGDQAAMKAVAGKLRSMGVSDDDYGEEHTLPD